MTDEHKWTHLRDKCLPFFLAFSRSLPVPPWAQGLLVEAVLCAMLITDYIVVGPHL